MALQKANQGGATPFKFQSAGDSIKGYYQGQVQKTINGSPAIEHTYKTEAGIVGVLGQANILNQIKNNNITPGTYVEITFSGKMQKLKSGKTMKVYDVSFDTEDLDTDASAPVADEGEPDEDLTDEVLPVKASKPSAPAVTPSAANQARIQALLNRSKS